MLTEEYGRYVCDRELMLREIQRLAMKIREATAYEPCAVRVSPADARELARALFPDTDGTIDRVLDLWVVQDGTLRSGVAEVLQCPLPHPYPEDCAYQARARRRPVSGSP